LPCLKINEKKLKSFFSFSSKGEKLTLDVTILLSLTFYLQIISDYVPRGFSKVPLLTLFTLGNFFLVFLSCVFTVLVLRLYHRPPKMANNEQVPFVLRFILFKCVGPVLFMKFHYRKRGETYEQSLAGKNKNRDGKNLKDEIPLRPMTSESAATLFNEVTEPQPGTSAAAAAAAASQQLHVQDDLSGRTRDDWDKETVNAIKMKKVIAKTNKVASRGEGHRPMDMLRTLRMLKRCIVDRSSRLGTNLDEYEVQEEVAAALAKSGEKSMYYYEWKQASVVLDRYTFFLFFFFQPL
jgi:hypothetical protein